MSQTSKSSRSGPSPLTIAPDPCAASAVRDQYAHQAHTIIIGDESHLGFYGQAQTKVHALTQELRKLAEGAEDRALVDGIDEASADLKARILSACVATVLSDRRVTIEEAELVRAVSASLGLALPPVVVTGA